MSCCLITFWPLVEIYGSPFQHIVQDLHSSPAVLVFEPNQAILVMSRMILTTLNDDPWTPSKDEPYVLPSQETLQDLLCQLENGDFDHWSFVSARKHLRWGHVMRAIQDCSLPFEFGARVSRSGRYLKFSVCVL